MTHDRPSARAIVAVAASFAVALAGAVEVIGERARLVHVLGIFAGGIGTGAGLARVLPQWRASIVARVRQG